MPSTSTPVVLRRVGPRMAGGFALLAVAACGGTDGDAPLWEMPPTMRVELVEGGGASVPLGSTAAQAAMAIDDQDVVAAVDAARSGPPVLALYARQAAVPGPRDVVVELTSAERAERHDVPIEVVPNAWGDGLAWEPAFDEGPEAREHGVALVTPDESAVFVLQGSGYFPQFVQMLDDVWRLDLATRIWTRVEPAGDALDGAGSRRAAPGRASGEWLLFGGYRASPTVLDELVAVSMTEDGTSLRFERLEQGVDRPASRSLHAFVKDPNRQRWILYGGVQTSALGTTVLGDTWELTFDASGVPVWRVIDTGERPAPRYGFFYGVAGGASARLVVFSGARSPIAGDPVNPADDVWSLDLGPDDPTWARLDTTGAAPPGRRNGCGVLVESAYGASLYVFGGTADARSTVPGLAVLDLRFGAWHDLSDRPGAADARSSGFGFALTDGTMACGFGNSNDLFTDLAFFGPAR